MSDARLLEWLHLTRDALAEPDDVLLDTLDLLCARRSVLRSAFEEEAPSAEALRSLAAQLRQAETDFQLRLSELRDELRRRVEATRALRRGASGYRPTQATHPAFVSRSV